MTSQEKIEKSAGISRRAFVGLSAAAGVAAGFLVGWVIKAPEEVVKEVTKTSTVTTTAPGAPGATVTTTATVTQPGAPGATVTTTERTTATVSVVAPAPGVEVILPMRRVTAPMTGYHIVVDYDRCTGCRVCEFECTMKYQPTDFRGVNLEYSRIRHNRFLAVDIPVHCNYCHLEEWVEGTTMHPCQFACPFESLVTVKDVMKEGEVGRGYRWIDPVKCTGMEACGRCAEICEEQFGSGIMFLPPDDKGISRAVTCTMCAGQPACVNACPEQALRFEAPGMDGRYYAQRPTDLAEMLYMKLFHLRRKLR